MPNFASAMMDPLEAGERVLNGVVNNDLFILSHPEFKAGMQERFDADHGCPPPRSRRRSRRRVSTYESRVLRCGIYEREIEHRKVHAQRAIAASETLRVLFSLSTGALRMWVARILIASVLGLSAVGIFSAFSLLVEDILQIEGESEAGESEDL